MPLSPNPPRLAGRSGQFSYTTNRCPAGQVILGIQVRRWAGGPGASPFFTSTLYNVAVVCGNPFPAKCQPNPPPRWAGTALRSWPPCFLGWPWAVAPAACMPLEVRSVTQDVETAAECRDAAAN